MKSQQGYNKNMELHLGKALTVQYISNISIGVRPRWGLVNLSLLIAPYHDSDEHEKNFVRTVGSGSWYRSEGEEFRFDPEHFLLQSLWLHIPETNISIEELTTPWISCPITPGTIRLCSQESVSLVQPTSYRWMTTNGLFFICLSDEGLTLSSDRKKDRINITRDFDLLFLDGQYCGWILSNPLRYFVELWEFPVETKENDENLEKYMHEYIELVSEPNIDNMIEEDTDTKAKLMSLRKKILRSNASMGRHLILSQKLLDLLDKFY